MADFPTTGHPPMIGRRLHVAEWTAYLRDYDFGRVPPTRIVLHHTYIPNEKQWAGLRSMQGMQRYYAGLGWSSAPHIYVGPDGIWLFTPMSRVGIHAGLGNQGVSNGVWWYSIGVEMVGYFDYARPAGAVWQQTRAVLGTLCQRMNGTPNQLISFHRDYTNQKSCPGWAVTKQWVFAEVDAFLSQSAGGGGGEVGEIGKPTPPDEIILDRLVNESYSRRSTGYNAGWAFHQYAVAHGMGMPIGDSKRLAVDGKSYTYQPFARDTLYSEIPNWGTVLRLSELLSGSIPPSGLGRALLEATYQAGGSPFHPEWAFHQYAISADLGPPIGASRTIHVGGAAYAYQAFARDTLYNKVPDWGDVKQLGRLANANSPADVHLRDSLLAATYQNAGARYVPAWAFHQLARTWHIGAPLSDPYGVDIDGTRFNIQVYAMDTLYNIGTNWGDVRRLSALAAAQDEGVFGMAFETSAQPEALDVMGASFEPPAELANLAFQPLHYTPAVTSHSSRHRAPIGWLVLHGDPGPAVTTLEQMAEVGATTSAHYYILTDGTIYQLVDEQYATWHAGSLVLHSGRDMNMNRFSIGIVLERPLPVASPHEGEGKLLGAAPGEPLPEPASLTLDTPDYSTQRAALRWLVQDIARRHPRIRVTRWQDMPQERTYAHSTQPLDDITYDLLFGEEA